MPFEFLDSHAHLDFDSFDKDRQAVLDRAWGAGCSQIISIGLGLAGAKEAIDLARSDPRIWATVGVHPHEADLEIAWEGDATQPVSDKLRSDWAHKKNAAIDVFALMSRDPKVIAIGEVGLDYHYDNSPRPLQRDLFKEFIRLAVRLDLPLVIHCREAEPDCIEILKEENAQKVGGVIHCFSGEPELARAGMDMGFHFGLAGPLTFKKAGALRAVVKDLPMDRLLVETDCPYLAPTPYRGKRNEPSYVVEVVKTLANMKDLPVEEVGRITAQNARRVFKIGH